MSTHQTLYPMIRLDSHSLLKGIKKAFFYVSNFAEYAVPNALFRSFYRRYKDSLSLEELAVIKDRVDYYVRLPQDAKVNGNCVAVADFKYPFGEKHKFSAYFFDLYEVVKYFNPKYRFSYIFGDVNWEANSPTITKSRPIVSGQTMDALAKLNKVRHFKFVNDPMAFTDKKDIMIFRNVVKKQPHRTKLLEMYLHNPLCDIGQINPCTEHPEYVKDYVPIAQMLKYKFICCIEGNDVATNLKWVMSSNSVAVMPKPKIESWFMEGRLIGGIHYIEINDDYTDLEEKLRYYIAHPTEAQTIINNAHKWVAQFKSKKIEFHTQLRAMNEYFRQTGQEITESPV